ncbi:MAG: L-piperidine-6-carboxylate dehydrogenase [Thermoplasmatota archaeon]
MALRKDFRRILSEFGLEGTIPGATDGKKWFGSGKPLDVVTPIDGSKLATVKQANAEDYERVVRAARASFDEWRQVPAPKRGLAVRAVAERLREQKDVLGDLVTLEMGKIRVEGRGEVQEMIDVADFAVGLSRQLYGNTMASERPQHRMMEQWHPLGVVGVISAFNFPVAVWSWNAFLAAVCGDATVWKPASKVPLTAIAVSKIANEVMEAEGHPGVFTLAVGPGSVVGDAIAKDRRIPLVSMTGSCKVGYGLAATVAERLGRSILELGGNNGIVVGKSADLDLATHGILFGAVGTAGQRCTSTRRVIVHKDIANDLAARLVRAYKQVKIGDPLDEKNLMGPLVEENAVTEMFEALAIAKKQGGKVLAGGNRLPLGTTYVEPTIVKIAASADIVKQETFAPLLWFIEYAGDIEDAIRIHNDVPQGLSSAIFTRDVQEGERFVSAVGSDCGIANVNLGTSGAEIGGAFGGEKETGGGRESGSDSWKQYMRRQTSTVNWSDKLPLAQGITFGEDE